MRPNRCHKKFAWLLLAIFLMCSSCSKSHNNPININTDTAGTSNVKLQPFSAKITFLSPNEGVVTWSASRDSLNDSIYYRVLLSGKLVDNNLSRLNDTLKNLATGLSYQGSVIAYNRFNDTVSAPFNLDLSSIAYAYYYIVNPGFSSYIECQNLLTNQLVWNCTGGLNYAPFFGTPAVVNDTLYACYNDIDYVFAVNASTGKVIWQSVDMYATAGGTGAFLNDGGPIYSNGRLYIASSSYGVSCLNSATGQVLWTNYDGTWYYTTPVVDGGKVFEGTFKYIYSGLPTTNAFKAIDANSGATIWTQDLPGQTSETPIVCNGLLIFTSAYGTCTALDENTGAQVWSNTLPGPSSNITHYNNLVIGWFGTQLYALDATTGLVVWQMTSFDGGGDPFVSNDTVFVQDLIYAYPNNTVQLLALRATTGNVLWSDTAATSSMGSLIVAGGKIYTQGGSNQSLNVYSTKDGSLLQNVGGTLSVISLNGVSYYSASSGMVQ